MGNIIAIIGRPNVGKSTLFNRLIESKRAIVDEISGVTRDRHYGKGEWNGKDFSVIDTGGLITHSGDIFEEEIRKQVLIAIEECDLVLFLVDVTTGITDLDEEVAMLLRKSGKKYILVVNKVDINERITEAQIFYKLGADPLFCISSINGFGTGDLLDYIVTQLPEKASEDNDDDIPRFAVIGRPNVGKSTLINSLIGEERNIVTPIAGTTRDTIHTRYKKFNHDFILVDTAGLRKKGKVTDNLEFYSVLRSIRAIENSDVCLLLIDAARGIEAQDVNIFRLIQRNNKGAVILVNKWDTLEKQSNTADEYKKAILHRIAPFQDVPVVFISALEKTRIFRVLETAMHVFENRKRKIPTSKINNIMLAAIESYPPPAVKGKYIKIKYVTQLPTYSPSFAFFCNLPQYIRDPYRRYLENKLRDHFDFSGVPLQLFFRKK